jgi:hypothetical protein
VSCSSVFQRETAFVATTTVHFNPATGEPVRAVATLTNETFVLLTIYLESFFSLVLS